MSFLLFCFVLYGLSAVQGKDTGVTVEQWIKRDGYPVELHQVVTEDNYILNMYRIPHGLEKSKNESKNKSVVLLVHGQGGGPLNFLTLGRKHAPAYYFADRGFDVWLFCARGVECQNPQKHKKLDWNKDPIYWDFSFHEIGVYDLPASIDVILNKTGQKKIFYIGHSAGGPVFYALMSEKPQYNDKIKIHVNYAAIPILKEVDYPFLQVAAQFSNLYKNLWATMGMYELFPPFLTEMLGDAAKKACADPKWFRVCKVSLWCVGSHVSDLIEDDVVETVFSVTPRLSIKQLAHFMDNMNRGDFRKYDYGAKKNMLMYGTRLPPAYNLTACTVPNAFFYGATDSLNVQADVWAAEEALPNTILDYEVGPRFVHLDFIFAKNATHMVYEPTVKLFRDFDAGVIPPRVIRRKK